MAAPLSPSNHTDEQEDVPSQNGSKDSRPPSDAAGDAVPTAREGAGRASPAHPMADTDPMLPPTVLREDAQDKTKLRETRPTRPGLSTGDPRDRVGEAFGRYRLLEELGRGGMGIVWKAWDTELKRVTALKQIGPGYQSPGEGRAPEERKEHYRSAQVERFLREARAAARLQHPNIVQVYDVGILEGKHYLTMEYVEGDSLEKLSQGKKLELRRALELVRDIGRALDYAHEHGIVHRDVKPANILVDEKGTPRVTDFGLAKDVSTGETSELTRSGDIFGTPHYMSPEQAAGRTSQVGPASDQYSLGVVLYKMATGTLPFATETLRDLLNELIEKEPLRLRAHNPRLHRDVETICLKALEKDPGRRYATVADMAADLERHLQGEPIEARPSSSVSRLWRRAVKRKATVIPIATVLLIGIAAVAGMAIKAKHEREQEKRRSHLRAEAMEKVRAAEGAMKDAARYLYRKGPLDEMRKEVEAVFELLDAAERQAPELADIDWARGKACECLFDDEKALAHYDRALQKDPGLVFALAARGRLYLKKYEETLISSELGEEEKKRQAEQWHSMARADLEAARQQGGAWGTQREQERDLTEAMWPLLEGRYDQVIETCERLIEKYGEGTFGVEVFFTLQGSVLPAVGRPEEALEVLEKALELRPSYPEAWFWSAIAREAKGELEQAIESYTAALKLNPRFVMAYSNRGSMRKLSGDPAGSIEDHTEALKLNPQYANAYFCRGNAYKAIGDQFVANGRLDDAQAEWASAIDDYNEALRLRPRFAAVYINRGLVRQGNAELLAMSERLDEARAEQAGAIEDYDEALKLSPQCVSAYYNRGNARLDQGELLAMSERLEEARVEWRGAIEDYTEALRINPNYAKAYHNRAIARRMKGELEGAIADYTEVLRLNPNSAAAHDSLGSVRQATGDLEGAIQEYTQALSIDPGHAPAYNNRGNVRLALGDLLAMNGRLDEARAEWARAIEDYTGALSINPRFADAYVNRGNARQLSGDRPGAIVDYERALETAPRNWPPREQVEAVLEQLTGGEE